MVITSKWGRIQPAQHYQLSHSADVVIVQHMSLNKCQYYLSTCSCHIHSLVVQYVRDISELWRYYFEH